MKITAITPFLAAAATLLLATPTTVNAHGQMTKPTPRPISQQYRADCGALSGAGDQELQYAPVELLSSRAQSDRPAAATFNIMNGCRGTVYEANNTVTELTAGTPFDVEWVIQAPHPGTMVLSVVKPSTDSSGTITYESVAELLTIDPFAQNSNDNSSTTATIPTSVTGCGSAGDCALQFYWHSDLASQTYPTCADITIPGSGAGSSSATSISTSTTVASSTSSASASASESTTTTTAPTATTAASTTTTDDSEAAGEASYTADSTDASADETTATSTGASADTTTDTSSDEDTATTTDVPTSTTVTVTDAPISTSTSSTESDKCSVRRRRRMRQ